MSEHSLQIHTEAIHCYLQFYATFFTTQIHSDHVRKRAREEGAKMVQTELNEEKNRMLL